MTNLFFRIVAAILGLLWIWWIIACVRRGRFPVGVVLRRDYIERGHDGFVFWLMALFYGSLGIAIVIAAIVDN